MFESIVQQLTGEGGQNVSSDQVHGHLDSLLGNADSGQATGAVNDALQSLGAGGFARSVEGAAQNLSPQQRGQIGSLLTGAIQQGGGNPSSVLGSLGIGGGSGNMGSGELGALAHYVASNHGGELSGILGGLSSGGGSTGSGNAQGGGGLGGEVVHLLGEPMVQQTAMNLAKRFL